MLGTRRYTVSAAENLILHRVMYFGFTWRCSIGLKSSRLMFTTIWWYYIIIIGLEARLPRRIDTNNEQYLHCYELRARLVFCL